MTHIKIKKIIVLLLLLLVGVMAAGAEAAVSVSDGAYVGFGSWNHATSYAPAYEGTDRTILWKKTNGVYVSEYLLDMRPWNTSNSTSSGWAGSALFSWLNGSEADDFYGGAFTALEKSALNTDADGDPGAKVTLPTRVTSGTSRFGVRKYRTRTSGNEYWIRAAYSTTNPWGVGAAGNQGYGRSANSTNVGLLPIISLNLAQVLLKQGEGSAADPYQLYMKDDLLQPVLLSVSGRTVMIQFGRDIEALGTLPAASDFVVAKNDVEAPVASVSLSGAADTLILTLAEAAVYGEAFKVSYNLALEADGSLTGGAIKAQSELSAAASFADLTAKNETPATEANVTVTPEMPSATAYRDFDETVIIGNSTGGNLVLNGVTGASGWAQSGLDFAFHASDKEVRVWGMSKQAGSYSLLLDVTIDGTRITTYAIDVLVEAVGTEPNFGHVVVTPDEAAPFVLRAHADRTYTVTSSITDSYVALQGVTGDEAWSESGLTLAQVYGTNRFMVSGTPVKTGLYPLTVVAAIDGTLISDKVIDVEVVYPPTNPTPADVLVTSDLVGSLLTGTYEEFTYTVSTSIAEAEFELVDARGTGNWGESNLAISPNYGAGQATVLGIPTKAGTYTVAFVVVIDGTVVPKSVSFIVGNPITAGDITITPAIPNAKAYRDFNASATIGTSHEEAIVLNDVTPGATWQESGLQFTFDSWDRSVTISGMPVKPGTYELKLDVTIGETNLTNGVVRVTVDPVGSEISDGNVVVTPDKEFLYLKAGEYAEVNYSVGSGILDAYVRLLGVTAGDNWEESGLTFTANPETRSIQVSGTPTKEALYPLLLDVEIDGTLIEGYKLGILVIEKTLGGSGDGSDNGGSDGGGNDGGSGGDGSAGGGGSVSSGGGSSGCSVFSAVGALALVLPLALVVVKRRKK